MKTCVVTGGAGFIGSHLIRELSKKYRVICIDNFSSGSKGNIEGLDITLMEQNVAEQLEIEDEVDYIFHLASRASPVDFSAHAIDIMLTNSIGTLNMLNLARQKSARFLLASTSEIYGDPLEHPQKETYFGNVNTLGVRACYDESKRFAEALSMSYHRKFGLDIRIARIFNTYGPNMRRDDGRAVPSFISQALAGKPIVIHGTGEQTRSFCYVSDLVEGIMKFMFKDNLAGAAVNLGNDVEFKVIEAAKIVKDLTGSGSEIVFAEKFEGDPERRRPDLLKAKALLGWEPRVGFREGLEKTINYFKHKAL